LDRKDLLQFTPISFLLHLFGRWKNPQASIAVSPEPPNNSSLKVLPLTRGFAPAQKIESFSYQLLLSFQTSFSSSTPSQIAFDPVENQEEIAI
jgi:hypothetical protein